MLAAVSASSPNNPVCFFDVSLAGQPMGRIKMELFMNATPKTAENFRQFCTGEHLKNNKPVGYKNCNFHRGFMIQGGDFVNGDGTGSTSIYSSEKFADENFDLKHDRPGLLSMANSGVHSNGCQFFITCAPCDFLDDKHVVFGQVVEGLKVVRMIERVSVGANNKPISSVTITECGQWS